MRRLVVVGHCTIDDIHHADGRVVLGTFGGAAAYASLGASMAGAEVTLVSVVGDDYPLDRLTTQLRAGGDVDTSAVRTVAGRSIHNDAWYGADGSRRFDVEDWERLELLMPTPDDLPPTELPDAIVLLAPATVEQQKGLVEALAPHAAEIALDSELHYLDERRHRLALLRLAERVDYWLPSIEHLQLLYESSSRDPGDYLDDLLSLGCSTIVVKQGAGGSSVIDAASRTLWHAPALDGLRIEDPTGAGDGYGGGFLAARARGAGHAEAAAAGTVSASFVVESTGAAVPAHFTPATASGRRACVQALVEMVSLPARRNRRSRNRMNVETKDARSTRTLLEMEIPAQGAVLRRVLERRTTVAEVVGATRERAPSSWVVTGCGDSLFAGMCGEYWFAEGGGVPLRAVHALAFSRYLYRTVDQRSVVFAISYSGTTRRVLEAAVAAKSRGAAVVAITTNASSPLVELADWWLPNDAIEERSNCRTMSFQATCALLNLAAAEIVEATVPSADVADAVETLATSAAEPIREIVCGLPAETDITVIGGGWAHPVACYGAAKLYEAATIPAHTAELEQFIHCEIFSVTPASTVVLVAPSGPSYARAVEVAEALGKLGAHTVGISDDRSFADACGSFCALPEGLGESAVPYLASVPLQLFALEWALRRGENPDLVSNKAVNRPLIESRLAWMDADYEAAR